jgi:4-hydroxy-3-methylbut-2-enyl diphosphate reductase
VVKVQAIIHKYAQKGYATLIVGDEKHPEVVGLSGYAKGRGHVVTSLDQLRALPRFDAAVVVAQTTQNTADYSDIKAWCETQAPHYKVFDTICGSTEKRQAEIRKLAEENDAVIVVGGKQSGNTKRLAQIATRTGKPVVHIEEVSQIDYGRLSSAGSVAITAGASTPNWIINEAYEQVANHLQRQHPVKTGLFSIRDFLLKTNIMAAAGAGFLTYACSRLQGIAQDSHHALIAMLYVLSMQILNHLFTVKSDTYNHPQRADFYENNRRYLWLLAVLSGAAGLYLSFITGGVSFMILLVMSLLGLSYNLQLIPLRFNKRHMTRIKDIPGSKTILIVMAWGMVTCLLPAVSNHNDWRSVSVVFLFAVGLVFARTAFFDIVAIQGDRITGKETLPILLGEKRSFAIIKFVLIADMGVLMVTSLTDLLVDRAVLLVLMPLGMLLLIRFFKHNRHISGAHREFIMEGLFVATGLLSVLI